MTTFTNARVFDGSAMLPGTRTVTLDGNRIAAISDRPGDAEAIDLAGMTLMPGLITSHFHPDFYKFKLGGGHCPGQGTAARCVDGDRRAQLRRAAGKRFHWLCRSGLRA